MRILHINMFADRVGGAEVYMNDLVEAQEAAGHAAAIFAGHREGAGAGPKRFIVQRPDWDGSTLIGDQALEDAFDRCASAFRPEVVHLHNLHHFSVGLIDRVARLGVPVVQTIHDAGLFCSNCWLTYGDGRVCPGGVGIKCTQNDCQKNYPFDARSMLGIQLRLEALRRTVDGWLAPSEFFTRLCKDHGLEPAERLPYAALPPVPGVQARPSAKQVLFAGRLVPEKGVEYLLRGWAEVQRVHPEARLVIAGDGPGRGSLEALAKECGLDPAQVFLGKVPHAEVRTLMLESMVLVLPSIWVENSPLACYEALQIGLPMAASNIGGLTDLVIDGQTGRVFPTRDARGLGLVLAEMLGASEDWKRYQAKGQELVRAFDPKRHLEAVLAAYGRAAQRGTQHRRAIDLDLVKSSELLSRKLVEVERWANDMRGHIDYLESSGSAKPPLNQFLRHMRYWWRGKKGKT